MKTKKILSVLLTATMVSAMFTGCGGGESDTTSADTNTGANTPAESGSDAAKSGEIKEFTAFFAVPGSEKNDDNEIQQMIAEKTGASTATISRVNRSLNYGNDGYDMVFARIDAAKEGKDTRQ